MRNTFFILIFLNAAAFLWLYGKHDERSVPTPQSTPTAGVEILEVYVPESLLNHDAGQAQAESLPVVTGASEPLGLGNAKPPSTPSTLKPLPQTSPAPSTQTAQISHDGQTNCEVIGPIADKNRAVGAQAYLMAKGYKASWVEREHTGGPVKFGYRVFIPSYASFAQAKEATEVLKENGIEDFYMITKSDTMQYAIALGVFSRMEGVKIRSEQVQKIGFETRYEAREREQDSVFWVTASGGKTLSESDKKALDAFGIDLTYTKKMCSGA